MAGGDQVDGVGSALRVWGVEDGDGGGEPGWGQPLPDGRVGHGTLLCQKGERVATAAAVPARAGGAPGRANGSGDRMHAPHGMNACAAPNVKCGKPWGDREGLAAAVIASDSWRLPAIVGGTAGDASGCSDWRPSQS